MFGENQDTANSSMHNMQAVQRIADARANYAIQMDCHFFYWQYLSYLLPICWSGCVVFSISHSVSIVGNMQQWVEGVWMIERTTLGEWNQFKMGYNNIFDIHVCPIYVFLQQQSGKAKRRTGHNTIQTGAQEK